MSNNAGWWLFEADMGGPPYGRKNFALYAGSGFEIYDHFSNVHHTYDPSEVIVWIQGKPNGQTQETR